MGFSAFTKFTVKRLRRLDLLTMGFFTKSKGGSLRGVHGFAFTKEKMSSEQLAWRFFTFKSKRVDGVLELLTFKFSNSNGNEALLGAGVDGSGIWT